MVTKQSAPDRTPWFPTDIAPARAGVYEVEWVTGVPVYAKYSRGIWHFGSHVSPAHARCLRGFNINIPPNRWRGLAADPKAAQ